MRFLPNHRKSRSSLEKSELPEGAAISPLYFIRHEPLTGRLRGSLTSASDMTELLTLHLTWQSFSLSGPSPVFSLSTLLIQGMNVLVLPSSAVERLRDNDVSGGQRWLNQGLGISAALYGLCY